jgi:transposase-like protein
VVVGGIVANKADQGGKMQEKETLDEKLPGLFEPDTLLPIQYFEAMRRKHLLEGEKRLILSVLEDAVECYMKCIDATSNKGQRLFREADEWINLEDKHWVFSFDNVCDMLDINPEYMRRGLKRWKERKLEAMAAKAATAATTQVENVTSPAKDDSPEPELSQVLKPAVVRPIPAKVLSANTVRTAPHKHVVAGTAHSVGGLRKARG